jgi:signal recognition particle subunit SEC65
MCSANLLKVTLEGTDDQVDASLREVKQTIEDAGFEIMHSYTTWYPIPWWRKTYKLTFECKRKQGDPK